MKTILHWIVIVAVLIGVVLVAPEAWQRLSFWSAVFTLGAFIFVIYQLFVAFYYYRDED